MCFLAPWGSDLMVCWMYCWTARVLSISSKASSFHWEYLPALVPGRFRRITVAVLPSDIFMIISAIYERNLILYSRGAAQRFDRFYTEYYLQRCSAQVEASEKLDNRSYMGLWAPLWKCRLLFLLFTWRNETLFMNGRKVLGKDCLHHIGLFLFQTV